MWWLGSRNGELGVGNGQRQKTAWAEVNFLHGQVPYNKLCGLVCVFVAAKSRQHPDFPGGHPPEYYPSLRLLNFAERTGYGVLSLRWPSTHDVCTPLLQLSSGFGLSRNTKRQILLLPTFPGGLFWPAGRPTVLLNGVTMAGGWEN